MPVKYKTMLNTTTVTKVEQTLNSHKDTPYLALMGELWGVCCEYGTGEYWRVLHCIGIVS